MTVEGGGILVELATVDVDVEVDRDEDDELDEVDDVDEVEEVEDVDEDSLEVESVDVVDVVVTALAVDVVLLAFVLVLDGTLVEVFVASVVLVEFDMMRRSNVSFLERLPMAKLARKLFYKLLRMKMHIQIHTFKTGWIRAEAVGRVCSAQ